MTSPATRLAASLTAAEQRDRVVTRAELRTWVELARALVEPPKAQIVRLRPALVVYEGSRSL